MFISSLSETDRYLWSLPEADRVRALAQIKRLVTRHGAAMIGPRGPQAPPVRRTDPDERRYDRYA